MITNENLLFYLANLTSKHIYRVWSEDLFGKMIKHPKKGGIIC